MLGRVLGRRERCRLDRRQLRRRRLPKRRTLSTTLRYAHDATLRYANAVATCGAAAALQLGAFGHSVCSSSPPGAVVVDACCAFASAHRALRALSLTRLRCRFRSRSMLRLSKRPAAFEAAPCVCRKGPLKRAARVVLRNRGVRQ